jgi:hypothetical protein
MRVSGEAEGWRIRHQREDPGAIGARLHGFSGLAPPRARTNMIAMLCKLAVENCLGRQCEAEAAYPAGA